MSGDGGPVNHTGSGLEVPLTTQGVNHTGPGDGSPVNYTGSGGESRFIQLLELTVS